MDKDTKRLLILGFIAVVFGPTIIRKLIEGIGNEGKALISDVTQKAEDLATGTINAGLDMTAQKPVYVGGNISYQELAAEFGDTCAGMIVTGNTFGKMVHCPWGWQDKVLAMQTAKGGKTLNGFSDQSEFIDLKRGKNGVYYG